MIRTSRASTSNPLRSLIAATATAALIATGLIGATGAAAAPQTIGGGGQTTFEPGRYIVTLAEPAAATYEGGIEGFAPTAPEDGDQLNARRAPVTKYTDYLEGKQQELAAKAGVEIDYSYTVALNGFSAELTVAQAVELSASKDVVAVTPDELKHITAVPSTEFLGLSGDDGVWAQLGGVAEAGAGVVVGVLDTGIAPENPSFAGEPLTGTGSPSITAGVTSYVKGDGATFTGLCQTGEQFTVEDCNSKVIGARYYLDGFGSAGLGDASVGEYVSPRDGDGHGSHTASTAAGNADVPTTVSGTDFGLISGVAPAAKVAAYKVCWSGPDPAVTTDDGCAGSDLVAGIEQAVTDGVDVINYSIGGGAASTTFSPTDEAFLGAAAAGIFVSASAGNDGPGSSTLDNAAPWITTVAASSIPSYEATATFSDGQAFAGASITVDMDPEVTPLTGPVVTATAVAAAGAEDANLCLPGTLDPALVEGNIVVCERGVNARAEKSAVVADAGGIGAIVLNVTPGSIDLDEHAVPTVHLDAQYHDAVWAAASVEGATVTFTPGNSTDYTPPTPQVAGFSSRGPVLADGSDVLKPDIAAPGVAILAATANAADADPTYAFISGTSMAAPHIAGLAALYLGERPDASPSEIKSAMMTTAYNTVDGAGDAVTDPFIQGAGHVDPTSFFEPGLLYLSDVPDWLAYLQGLGWQAGVEPIDASNLNLPSIAVGALTAPETITRTVTATEAGTFTPSVEGLAGVEAVVSPSSLAFTEAGQSLSYTVTFTRSDAALDEFSTGSLTWTSSSAAVRIPVAVQPVTIVAPASAAGEGVTGEVDITVTPGGTGDIALSSTGLSKGELLADPTGIETEHSGSGTTGDEFEYEVTVPEGTTFARFDLDSIDDTADLDLIVYRLNAAGTPVAGWQSATGAADERVDLVDPTPATYLVISSIYSANPPTAFDLRVTSVVPGGAPIGLDPAVLAGVQGVPIAYTASWTDLDPHSTYLGLISYGDTGATTALTVTTGEAGPVAPEALVAPTITGTPVVGAKLRATPGEWDTPKLKFSYQWQRDGVDIRKATGTSYKVDKKDVGHAISVVVTARAKGLPDGTASSEAVTIKQSSSTTVSLSKHVYFSWQKNVATVKVAAGSVVATGTVTVKAGGTTTTVELTKADKGVVKMTLPTLKRGFHSVTATYAGSETVTSSSSRTMQVWVLR